MGQEPTAPASGQEPQAPETPAPSGDGKQEPKQFDESYVKELRGEAAGHRKKVVELSERLEELEARDQSETEKATGRADKAEKRASDAEAKLLRLEVALEKNVPADLIDFLAGSTREEVEQKADALLKHVAQPNDDTPPPDFGGGARPPVTPPASPEEQHKQLLAGLLTGRTP